MAIETEERAPEALVARVQELMEALESIADPFARTTAEELIGAVMDLYGEGLGRVLGALDRAGGSGAATRKELLDDGVFASLLLIHGMYPVPVEERVQEALDTVRPYMESHGGNVELLKVSDGIAHLALKGSCNGCPASRATLELAIEQAIQEAAPDLLGLEVTGVVEQDPNAVKAAEANGSAKWESVPVITVNNGALTTTYVNGVRILLAEIGGTKLAYKDECVSCGHALHDGRLKGGVLYCPGCEHRFYLPGAGRSMDGDRLQLEPVPLLADEAGGIKLAVAST